MMEIKSAEFVISNTDVQQCPDGTRPEYAFIGRSNVGKSSLINMLTARKRLAMTSQKPGKTQLINHFIINGDWYIVDLPGYGYAKAARDSRKTWAKFIEEYFLSAEELRFVCLLLDIRHIPMESDCRMFSWLVEHDIPVLVIATKADKIGKNARNAQIAAIQKKLGVPELTILPYASPKNEGRSDLLDVMAEYLVE